MPNNKIKKILLHFKNKSKKSNLSEFECSTADSSKVQQECSGLLNSTPLFQMHPPSFLKFSKTSSLSTSIARQLTSVTSYDNLTQLITESRGLGISGGQLSHLLSEKESSDGLGTISGNLNRLVKIKPDKFGIIGHFVLAYKHA